MLSYLADSQTSEQQRHFFQSFLFLSLLVLLNNISRYVLLAFSGVTGSRHLHEALTATILSAPLQFFDSIPSGRIISRFSSDMDTIDNDIPTSLSSSYDAFLGVLTGLVVVVINSPVFLVLIFPLGYQYLVVQRVYRTASVELKRLDSSSRSPVFSHFNETLSGLEYIRAYQLQRLMTTQHQLYLNRSISTRYNWDGVNRWLGIRLDLIGTVIVAGAAYSLLLVETHASNGGSAGLMVSYALKSTASLSLAVRTSTALENMLLSLSRVLEYIRISPELESIGDGSSLVPKPYQADPGDLESLPLLPLQEQSYLEQTIDLIGRGVTVSYHPTLPPVLRNINFELSGSKIVGLCGRTGGGKVRTTPDSHSLC
jgi:ATP-binding cassette, subfamily C (CFTR/MRP), member 1